MCVKEKKRGQSWHTDFPPSPKICYELLLHMMYKMMAYKTKCLWCLPGSFITGDDCFSHYISSYFMQWNDGTYQF